MRLCEKDKLPTKQGRFCYFQHDFLISSFVSSFGNTVPTQDCKTLNYSFIKHKTHYSRSLVTGRHEKYQLGILLFLLEH